MRKVGLRQGHWKPILGPFAKFSPCCTQEISNGAINGSVYWSESSEYCWRGEIEGEVHALSYGTAC